MQKITYLKFLSRLLLMVMLTVTINGLHEVAHADQIHVTAAIEEATSLEISPSKECPCAPPEQPEQPEQHKDSDGCDTCVSCTCHAPLAIQPFQLSYNPIIMDLGASETFKHLPEVYLTKFIPPQISA